ncbi:MAG: histidine kinase [Undibacterium umbellatum]|uniref:histidine kinase n=1 Tax=Undibacterium umbellatum TaxID=2762300 RepID=UPI003BB7AE94
MMPQKKWKLPDWKHFLFILLAWMLVIFFFSLAEYVDSIKANKPAAFSTLLKFSAMSFLSYILLSTILLIVFENLPSRWLTATHLLIIYVLMIGIFLPLEVCYEISTNYLFARKKTPPSVLQMVTNMAAMGWWLLGFQASVAYFMQVAATLWQRSREQARRTQELRQKNLMLRLSLMECQLEPYFLLSSLDGIGNLIRVAERSLATTALARLSDLLRYVLRFSGDEKPSMADELGFAKAYLSLQELRHGQYLQVKWTLSEYHWCTVSCPPLLLHAILDLALHWSVMFQQKNHLLQANLRKNAGMILFHVSLALETAIAEPDMTQIAAIRERLDILYAGMASLEMTQNNAQIDLSMCIPAGEYQDG